MQESTRSSSARKRGIAFGRVLRQVREERGLSQEKLGFESGYHRTYISFLERGLKNPTLSTILDLGEALQMPGSEMMRRVEVLLKLRFESR